MRALGAREIASGLGILGGRHPGAWLNARAGGDLMDLARLALAARGPDACIDTVGMEAHVGGPLGACDRAKQLARLQTDRSQAYRTVRDAQDGCIEVVMRP